ncbi:MAG: SDR family oxidoreductase [Cytophagaceae bacterium]
MNSTSMLKTDALKGKVILVTGGGTGLGKSMAKEFLFLGADLIIVSRKEEVLKAAAEELMSETKGKVHYFSCDVREYLEIEKILQTCFEKCGKIDVLVNNAAGNFISPTERLSNKAFDVVTDIVLRGSYNFTLALGKEWINRKNPGTVLNIVTTYASTGSGYVVPSAIAKAGVLAMTRSLASEWGKYDIRMNAIAPGPFPTEGAWTRLFPDDVANLYSVEKRIPVKRVGQHHELANLASYLVSDYSAYINGEVITIDGGEWLRGAGEFNFLEDVPSQVWDEVEKKVRRKGK